MLFWSPDQLPCLYCYPDTHLLRRRSRVNVHAPLDAARFPLFTRAAAAEALLEPGDVVFFPSRQVGPGGLGAGQRRSTCACGVLRGCG